MSEEQIWSLIIALAVLAIPFAVIEYIRVQRHKHHPSDQQYRYTSFNRVRLTATDHQYDYTPSAEASFKDQLTAAGMKPDVLVHYGQNAFAYDRDKGLMLIQSMQTPDCALLRSEELLVYELLYGVDVVAQGIRDGRRIPFALPDGMEDCDRIELQIETKNDDHPQIEMVLMPFRFERAEARASAMDAAREIVEALDGILSGKE